jgi:hypothetical protein
MMGNADNKNIGSSLYIGKVIFACWGAAVGLFILTVVIGLFIFGFKIIDKSLFEHAHWLLLAYMAISYPVIKKRLK